MERRSGWGGRGWNPRNVFSPEAPVTMAGEGRDASFVWLKDTEVGPPNLLQVEVEEQQDGKLSAANMRREKIEF